ncbi:MAG TPA: restriction endonuclease subunit S [Candidatus Krumholzibacteria bacterium]|nr:restriction endonuclease subunit S [Candidatus Krumholzibacteria bacterium]
MVVEYMVPRDWTWTRLGDVASVLLSNVDKKIAPDERPVRLCNYTDVYYNHYIHIDLSLPRGSATEREVRKFQLRKGDVLITKDSEDPNDIAVPALVTEDLPDVLCGYHLAIVRPKRDALDGGFLSTLLQSHRIRYLFSCLANGVTRFGLTSQSIEHARLPLPPLQEQRDIARLIESSDRAIRCADRLVELKVERTRGLRMALVTGHKRLPGFAASGEMQETPFGPRPKEWVPRRLGDILRDEPRHVTVEDNTTYRLVSVRRRSGGLFDREVRAGSDIGYDRLRVIKDRDFLIARRQVIHGAMAMATPEFEGAYVSDSYANLVTCTNELHMPYFGHLSRTAEIYYRAFRCSYGVAIEKMYFNLPWFLKETIWLPQDVEEQRQIAHVLDAADREIDLARREMELARQRKLGLMQKLLTGKKRIKI